MQTLEMRNQVVPLDSRVDAGWNLPKTDEGHNGDDYPRKNEEEADDSSDNHCYFPAVVWFPKHFQKSSTLIPKMHDIDSV